MTGQATPRLGPAAGAPDEGSLPDAVKATARALGRTRPVTIVLNDPQRDTRSSAVLQPIRNALGDVPVRALIATGTHRYPRAQRRAFEEKTLAGLDFEAVSWHDCRSGDLAAVGGGHPWRCHPWLLDEGHAVLAVGSCELHYFAGITGAHKTVTIGCAAFEDIERNHEAALSPDARPGRLEGNPVHEAVANMVGALEARREVRAINLLQVGGAVLSASAGDPMEALAALAGRVRGAYTCPIDRPADALVLEVPGVLGRSFYQADKAIKNNECAVRDGGCLVLEAPCPEGIGQDDFLGLLARCRTYDSAAAEVARRGYRLGDHKALKLRYLTDRRGVRVFAVSEGLTGEQVRLLGFREAHSAGGALAAAGIDPGEHAVYRVRDAGNACVTIGGDR